MAILDYLERDRALLWRTASHCLESIRTVYLLLDATTIAEAASKIDS